MSTLRERRRLDTAEAIRRAAIELAYDHGLDNVTTEMISEAAGISPRTFFNYFPYKEAALSPPNRSFCTEEKAIFLAGKGKLLDDFGAMLTKHLEHIGADREMIRKSHEISLSTPKLMAMKNIMFLEFEAAIADMLAERLGRDASEDDIVHMAAVIGATIRLAIGLWVQKGEGSLRECVLKRLTAIECLFEGK